MHDVSIVTELREQLTLTMHEYLRHSITATICMQHANLQTCQCDSVKLRRLRKWQLVWLYHLTERKFFKEISSQ